MSNRTFVSPYAWVWRLLIVLYIWACVGAAICAAVVHTVPSAILLFSMLSAPLVVQFLCWSWLVIVHGDEL